MNKHSNGAIVGNGSNALHILSVTFHDLIIYGIMSLLIYLHRIVI